ncbi:TonB-dependent receptor [Thermomonas brevis]
MMSKTSRSLPLRSGLFIAIGAALLMPAAALAQQAAEPQQQQQEQKQDDEPTTLDAVTVRSEYIPEPLLQSSSVISVVTQADFQRSGDGDAAQALQRVSGLSLVSDKYVYVRGLGERYSSALLNGSPLPSPEPLQRVVPLDLFPSEALAGVSVQKTFSVRYPGEFGGGVIDMQSLTVPEAPFAKLTVGMGGNSKTTGSPGLTHYGGGKRDFWGYDNGTRKLPADIVNSYQLVNASNYDFDPQRIRDFGRAMNDPNLYLLQQKDDIDPDVSFGGSAGTAFEIAEGWKLGLIGVANFENKWRTRTGIKQVGDYNAAGLEINQDFAFGSTRNNARVNGLFGIGLKSDRHSVSWTSLYVHDTLKETKTSNGYNFNSSGNVRSDGTLWLERELLNHQLAGKSMFGEYSDVEVEWRLASSEAHRSTPFETAAHYAASAQGAWLFSTADFLFGTVEDQVDSGGVDLTWHLPTERSLTLRVGGAYSENKRDAVQRFFRFQSGSNASNFTPYQRIEYALSDWNIQHDVIAFTEIGDPSRGAAAYQGNLEVKAAYAEIEGEIAANWRGSFGLRYEDATLSVDPLGLFTGKPVDSSLSAPPQSNDYLLPALTITWNVADNQQLRLGASKTIARPQFRELAPAKYSDPDNDRLYLGNPFLVDSELVNLDLRYEWYFGEGEYLTAGVFHKSIDKPVEAILFNESITQLVQSYVNAPKANLYGFEVDYKKYFDGIAWGDNRLYFAGNYTYSKSKVSAKDTDTVISSVGTGGPQRATMFVTDGGKMQGQSEHLANLQLGVESADANLQATLIANYVSERIALRGLFGQPDYMEKPGTNLDFVLRKRFDKAFGWDLGFKPTIKFAARNLLGTDHQEYQDRDGKRVDLYTYDPGRSWDLSLTIDF